VEGYGDGSSPQPVGLRWIGSVFPFPSLPPAPSVFSCTGLGSTFLIYNPGDVPSSFGFFFSHVPSPFFLTAKSSGAVNPVCPRFFFHPVRLLCLFRFYLTWPWHSRLLPLLRKCCFVDTPPKGFRVLLIPVPVVVHTSRFCSDCRHSFVLTSRPIKRTGPVRNVAGMFVCHWPRRFPCPPMPERSLRPDFTCPGQMSCRFFPIVLALEPVFYLYTFPPYSLFFFHVSFETWPRRRYSSRF